jgi:hypothetical protein
MKMKQLSLILGVILAAFTSSSMAALPYTFTSRSPILASQINANFAYLESLASASKPALTKYVTTSISPSAITSPIFTAAQNSVITGLFLTGGYTNCTLSIGTAQFVFFANQPSLAIPVASGEAVSIACNGTGSGVLTSVLIVSQ